MPADDGLGLDDGQVVDPVTQESRYPDPKCTFSGPARRPPGSALQNFDLVAQGEVLEGELQPGAEAGGDRKKDDLEHRGMLCSAPGNRNGRKAGGDFGGQPSRRSRS